MSLFRNIIYYTDNRLDDKIANAVRKQLSSIGLPIISSSLQPIKFGKNIPMPGERGYLTMFKQILSCLENSPGEVVYFCEHDVLYHPSHFDFTPPDERFYYNQNWWKIHSDGVALHWDADQVAGLACYKKPAIEWYRMRIDTFDAENFDRKFEPLSGEGSMSFRSAYPNIDIRHGHNLTMSKRGLHHFRNKATAVNFQEKTFDNIPGWSGDTLHALY